MSNQCFKAEIEFAQMSASTRLAIHSSLLTVNSVLIGAFGIIQSINESTHKITLLYLVISFLAMILILMTQARIRSNQIAFAINGVVCGIGENDELRKKYEHVLSSFKDKNIHITSHRKLMIMEMCATLLTFSNVLVFMLSVII